MKYAPYKIESPEFPRDWAAALREDIATFNAKDAQRQRSHAAGESDPMSSAFQVAETAATVAVSNIHRHLNHDKLIAICDVLERPKTESAWLIELGTSDVSRPEYWGGIRGWTFDNLKAIRFARKTDAENLVGTIGSCIPDNYRIAEHGWS